MKATLYDPIRILIDVRSEFRDFIVPRGTEGVVVEVYTNPEGYCIDLRIPDTSLVGGARWENVTLSPEKFEVIRRESK